jgi:hypothetical protein
MQECMFHLITIIIGNYEYETHPLMGFDYTE